jgi:drug/metabolite transporter (DMT)-like permease
MLNLQVTPMGSLAVVTSGILAHFILKERLTTFGWLGSTLSILGSVIIALNGPAEETSTTIQAFQKKFLSVGFLVWGSLCLVSAAGMVFFVAPKYGKKNMLVYITICSLLGGLSVACTSGLGGAILTSIRGDSSQWKQWFMYFTLAFVITTLLLEINYLNKALALYNSASVTAACEPPVSLRSLRV